MGSLFSLCALAWLYSTVRSSLLTRGGIAFANIPRFIPANAGSVLHTPLTVTPLFSFRQGSGVLELFVGLRQRGHLVHDLTDKVWDRNPKHRLPAG